jgi:hypothetical protein
MQIVDLSLRGRLKSISFLTPRLTRSSASTSG